MSNPLRLTLAATFSIALAASAVITCSDKQRPTPAEPGPGANELPEQPEPRPPSIDYDGLIRETWSLIRDALRRVEPEVRRDAIRALARLKDSESLDELMRLAERDPDPRVRGEAAEAIGKIGGPDANEALARLFEKADEPLRVWFAAALARLGHAEGVTALINYAFDDNLEVSFKAAVALAEMTPADDMKAKRKATRALVKLAGRESDLRDIAPFAGVIVLSKLARLGHEKSAKCFMPQSSATTNGCDWPLPRAWPASATMPGNRP